MTNFQKWQYLMKDIPSPQSYIDFGFHFLIAAALQRRVWVGPEHMPLFANPYIILVGDPGIGKGVIIKPVEAMMKLHKMDNPFVKPVETPKPQESPNGVIPVNQIAAESVGLINWQVANAENPNQDRKIAQEKEQPLLFPVAANATTWQALVNRMTRCTRRINFERFEPLFNRKVQDIYTHSSLSFCLEEIASLFRKHTEDVVNFLLQAYDCGDYDYETIGRGVDKIRKMCLSIFGGTTPDFMEETFEDRLLNQGFSSRAWYIFEAKNRFNVWKIPERDDLQKAYWIEIAQQLKHLSTLYGNVKYTKEADDWLNKWWVDFASGPRPNNSIKLTHYYSRKNIHIQKLAMAVHFGDCNDDIEPTTPITLSEVKLAMEQLNEIEKKMHLAISFDNKNPLASVARKALKLMKLSGPQSKKELLLEFYGLLPDAKAIDQVIEYLITVGKINPTTVGNTRKYEAVIKEDVTV